MVISPISQKIGGRVLSSQLSLHGAKSAKKALTCKARQQLEDADSDEGDEDEDDDEDSESSDGEGDLDSEEDERPSGDAAVNATGSTNQAAPKGRMSSKAAAPNSGERSIAPFIAVSMCMCF